MHAAARQLIEDKEVVEEIGKQSSYEIGQEVRWPINRCGPLRPLAGSYYIRSSYVGR